LMGNGVQPALGVEMSRHTLEPWSTTEGSACPMIMSGDEFVTVALSGSTVDLGRDKSNARRIVACVNALQGVPTEVLEQSVKCGITDVSRGNLFSSRMKLQRQRDKLLAALKDAQHIINNEVSYDVRCEHGYPEENCPNDECQTKDYMSKRREILAVINEVEQSL